MEKNPQDQNLGDAPDDQNKIFNPSNVLSESSHKKPVGPQGTPKEEIIQSNNPTDPNPVGQANSPTHDKTNDKSTDSATVSKH